jgi:hypothetical protein
MSVQLNSPGEFGSVYPSKSGEKHPMTSWSRRQENTIGGIRGPHRCSSAEKNVNGIFIL